MKTARTGRKRRWILLLCAIAFLGVAIMFSRRFYNPKSNKTVAFPVSMSPPMAQTIPKTSQAFTRPDIAFAESATKELAPIAPIDARTVIKYGRNEGQLGMIRENGQTPVGPESFTLDSQGNILLADTVNHRMLVFSADGAYLRGITFSRHIPVNDIVLVGANNFCVYDHMEHSLHLFDDKGALQQTLVLKPGDIDTRGYFHVVDGAVYFADAAERDVLVATFINGLLVPADTSAIRMSNGIHSSSSRIYSVTLSRGTSVQVEIQKSTSESRPLNVNIPLDHVVSAVFIGEDVEQNFYIQTEVIYENKVNLAIQIFNFVGVLQGAVKIAQNDYALWTSKLVMVTPSGDIVQFIPQREQAQICIYKKVTSL